MTTKCQTQSADTMHIGRPQLVPLPIKARLSMTIAHLLSSGQKRFIKKMLKRFTTRQPAAAQPQTEVGTAVTFKAGDVVRVRPAAEIRAMLDAQGKYKGCRFMPEQEPYCGTIQTVYKRIERYLNECDYTVRKAKGLVLLKDLMCQGVAGAGRCDRSCFYFWRVEWLELVPQPEAH